MTSAAPRRMRFGMFLPPFHHVPQNPTRLLQRDLETIELIERLGFEEAWVGEHHSGGFEMIGSNEVFLSAAAARTSRIRLGLGAVSLPYHNPFMVATRAVLLDHLSFGRVILGVGPGSLPHDAAMLGIKMSETRSMMREAWDVVHHLITSPEPITAKSSWYTLDDAILQLRPYSEPTMDFAFTAMESPFGPSMAGRYGAGLVSIAATTARGFAALDRHWGVVEEQAASTGRAADRATWRIAAPIHVAETREQARREVMHGFPRYVEYAATVAGRDFAWMEPEAGTRPPQTIEEILSFVCDDVKFACIGTPDDAAEFISRLVDRSGGFGCLLINHTDWASPEATSRSLEMFATEVMPRFQGSLEPIYGTMRRSAATREQALRDQRESINTATADYVAAGGQDVRAE